ncbi:MAG: sigma-54-dependent Fis family transcriptional regulator [Candidatus Omnitrophica bacterium]|nr:sigma-54-dependent Fis family transcriptional regulator [Candidatus Omnitrophota bacterium]
MHTILLVDDDPRIIQSLTAILEGDYRLLAAASGEEALEAIHQNKIDLIFLDIHMPGGMDGFQVLERIEASGENITTVVLTANDEARTAVRAMKLGAFDYITKPFDPEEILVTAEKALNNHKLLKEIIYFRSQAQPVRFDRMVGKAKCLEPVYGIINKVRNTNVTVLIQGETGTGKELVARALHDESPRKGRPFIAINCASIPENLMESELFGHEKGAFTGAQAQKTGRFELADEGTVFLDEISDLKLDLQAKILRILQFQTAERVGGTKTIKLDVRIIAATNIDLRKAVAARKFREDLFYRLNVVPVMLPPLRERREDIPLLVQHFLNVFNTKFRKRITGISQDALKYLAAYDWPGNVRELENMMERIVVLSEKDIIETGDLPFDIFLKAKCAQQASSAGNLLLKEAVDRFEKDYIVAMLEREEWNQTAAARTLGIHRNTLIGKMDQLGIKKDA